MTRGIRHFSSTPRCRRKHTDHYATLSVPRTATKAQIKTSYYLLSKKHHPDVAGDNTSQAKFHAVSEAYAVLGDDRKRREYDRSLGSPFRAPHASGQHPQATTTRPSQQPGFKHVWPNHPRNHARDPFVARHDYLSEHARRRPPGSDPFSNPFVQRATGRRRSEFAHTRPNPPSGGFQSASASASWTASSAEGKRSSTANDRPAQDDAAAQSSVMRALGASGLVGVIMLVAAITCNPGRTL